MRVAPVFVALAACGRLGFETATDRADTGVTSDTLALPPWSFVQANGSDDSSLMLSPTGSGDLIVVAVQYGSGGSVTGVADDAPGGSSPYVAVPGGQCFEALEGVTNALWYTPAAHPGATTISLIGDAAMVVWDVADVGAVSLDGVAHSDSQPDSLTPPGPPVTTTNEGDFIVSVLRAKAQVAIAADSPFIDDESIHIDGWAHFARNDAPIGTYQPQWTQASLGQYCGVTVAFARGR